MHKLIFVQIVYLYIVYISIKSCLFTYLCVFSDVMSNVSKLVATVRSVVDRGFESLLGQSKDYKIGICCFSTKHMAVGRKSKDLLAQNQDNVS